MTQPRRQLGTIVSSHAGDRHSRGSALREAGLVCLGVWKQESLEGGQVEAVMWSSHKMTGQASGML